MILSILEIVRVVVFSQKDATVQNDDPCPRVETVALSRSRTGERVGVGPAPVARWLNKKPPPPTVGQWKVDGAGTSVAPDAVRIVNGLRSQRPCRDGYETRRA
ncbi:Meiosis regulator and mRNA stability factor [Trichinella pseudospiralis]